MPKSSQGHNTFVRPQVEYGASVSDPHTTVNINKVEAVQRRAARSVTGDYRYTSSVTAMISDLEWESRQHRRQRAKGLSVKARPEPNQTEPTEITEPPQPHLRKFTDNYDYRYRVLAPLPIRTLVLLTSSSLIIIIYYY